MSENSFPYLLEYVNCDLCGANQPKTRYVKKGSALPIDFSIVQCSNCGLVYTNPRPHPSLTHLIYTTEYYYGEGCDPVFSAEGSTKANDSEMLLDAISSYFEQVHHSPEDRKILIEAGGGAGLICKAANDRHFNSIMTDLSPDSINIARNNGINCILGELDSEELEHLHGKVDVVVANEVIEHVYSPRKFLIDVFRLLRPGGIFCYTTGNYAETRLQGKNWSYMNIPDAHIHFFTRGIMDRYLKETGFSGRVDIYSFYTKNNAGYKLMRKLGIKLSKGYPKTTMEKLFYSHIFKASEVAFFRRRFDWAIK
ncbi:class I SAM-dependent methyltransferase [Cylindrospermopsis raciborskii]|uniref:class I SAM-dependent methyltransferase n=2 Tax=Cylindrospermopsis raciborskii TaxID=77022 RepID=UPI000E1F1A67